MQDRPGRPLVAPASLKFAVLGAKRVVLDVKFIVMEGKVAIQGRLGTTLEGISDAQCCRNSACNNFCSCLPCRLQAPKRQNRSSCQLMFL